MNKYVFNGLDDALICDPKQFTDQIKEFHSTFTKKQIDLLLNLNEKLLMHLKNKIAKTNQ